MSIALDKHYEMSVTLKPDKPYNDAVSSPKIDAQTGEIVDYTRQARMERYALQSAAKRILPKERVGLCMRYPIPNLNVEVMRHQISRKSFYCNLAVCSSVWTCPVCSAKISERRRVELRHVIDEHIADGGHVAMLTLTVRHHNGTNLYDMLERLQKAMERFRSGKRYDALRKKLDLLGTVRAFETTHGKNGWHPHFHVLLFYYNKVDLDDVGLTFYELWQKACSGSGLEATHQGFSIQNGDEASDYVSKWGVDYELTKSQTKRGGGEKGRTPFDILRDYLQEPKNKDADLFRDYSAAFKGRRQLVWSQGLKKQFELEEIDDQEVMQLQTEEADFLGMIPPEIWAAVYKKNLQSTLLELTEDLPFDVAIEEIKKNLS